MQQGLRYNPLDPYKIRVIRLFTEADHPVHATGPVHCNILQVPLKESYLVGGSKDATRGFSRTWPGLLERCFPFVRIPECPRLRTPKCLGRRKAELMVTRRRSNQDTKDHRPWRYTWGDFVAVSYAWGDPSSKREIFVDGIPVLVTVSLEAALRELRNHVRIQQGFLIWADALCINQEDLDERAAQVARMQDIYRAAWQLQQEGEMSIFYQRVQLFVVRLPFWQWKHTHTTLNIQKDALEAIYHFLARPYWRRLWIIQEVALGAANSPVLCGNSSLRLKDIFNALQFMKGDGAALGQYIIMSARGRDKITNKWNSTPKDTHKVSEKMWERPLAIASLQVSNGEFSTMKSEIYDVLLLAGEANASNERDRVYGILGLPQVAHNIQLVPDYNRTVSEIFTLFSANLYLSRNLNGLRLVNSPVSAKGTRYWKSEHFSRPRAPKFIHRHRVVHPGCKHDLPSWVICWSCPRNPAEPLNNVRSVPKFPSINPPSIIGNILTVRGVIFDTIATLSAFHATESDKSYPWNTPNPPISPYGSHDATCEALARTLTGNVEGGEDPGLDPSRAILDWRLWSTGIRGLDSNLFGLKDFYYRNKTLQLFKAWSLESLIRSPKSTIVQRLRATAHTTPRILHITATHREALSSVMRLLRLLRWRRLVTTSSGYLGLVSAATRAGDVIALVPGCDTPLVLRANTDTEGGAKFSVVGETRKGGTVTSVVTSHYLIY
ncbi:HET-domain-containing protein [Xylaria acuta]|nr:HET-domain-containing protein [Xylaria acuta]